MKNYSKIGNKKGKTAYRTPSQFIAKKVIRHWDLAARLEHRHNKEKLK